MLQWWAKTLPELYPQPGIVEGLVQRLLQKDRHLAFLFSFPPSLPQALEPSTDNGLICHALELEPVDQLTPPLASAHLGDQGLWIVSPTQRRVSWCEGRLETSQNPCW